MRPHENHDRGPPSPPRWVVSGRSLRVRGPVEPRRSRNDRHRFPDIAGCRPAGTRPLENTSRKARTSPDGPASVRHEDEVRGAATEAPRTARPRETNAFRGGSCFADAHILSIGAGVRARSPSGRHRVGPPSAPCTCDPRPRPPPDGSRGPGVTRRPGLFVGPADVNAARSRRCAPAGRRSVHRGRRSIDRSGTSPIDSNI